MGERETPGRALHRMLLANGLTRSRGRWEKRRPGTRAAYEAIAAAIRALPEPGAPARRAAPEEPEIAGAEATDRAG